ncbi:MAG: SusC/RagA family TonB-linked outer membrane protein [Chitinophagaceae bacterium]
MRKFVLMLSGLLLFCAMAFAQNRTVTGTVTDDRGVPLPFASILEAGTQNGITSDENGRFSITVRPNARLVISATGYEGRTVELDNATAISLVRKNEQLSEVVVTTAFGIRREQRITPYSAQTVDREQLSIVPQTNVNTALAGKIAGAQFRGQSAINLNNPGYLRLRGGLALGGDRGALYVVDGTPVNSFDINPDDIESVTVLKGANATALLGERAAGGAIMITTRKGGQRGTVGIEVNQGLTFDRVYILPKYQNLYAGGSTPDLIRFNWRQGMPEEWQQLDGKFYHDYTDDMSWGPRMAGQQYVPWYAWVPGSPEFGTTTALNPQPNNARDFWNTGITNVTNVSLSKGGEGFNFRISYTNNSIKGMLPNTESLRNTLFTTASFDLNRHFTVSTNISFVNNRINGVFDDGYSNQSSGAFNQWFHRNLDMDKMKQYKDLRTPLGTIASWNLGANPNSGSENTFRGNYWYNTYTWFEQLDNQNTRDRLFGDASLTYKLNDNFKIRGTVRRNQLTSYFENITPSILEESATQTGTLASYSTGNTASKEMNYELLASYNKRFISDKLNVSLNAGANDFHTRYRTNLANTVQGLNVPGLYAITNSSANANIVNTREETEVRSVFGFGDLEWNRIFAVNFALRNDWYSTLPAGDNSLLSPSAGASIFFSDFTRDALPWLSFGKVFGSWGKKPLSLDVYQNNFLYTINQNQWNGNYLTTTPNAFVSPGVKGALITTYEAGLDLRFVRNRYGLNFIYYNETSENPPLSVPVGAASGFTTSLLNATKVERQGIELVLDGRPIAGKNFVWEINKTFGYLLNNKVVELLPGQDRLLLAGGSFGTRYARAFQVLGEDWGQLIGGGIARNDEGQPLINTSGMFVRDADKRWGSIVPKVTGGLVNTFAYKNLSFNFNIGYQFGGKFFSLSDSWGHYSGLFEATAATNDRGFNVRDAVEDGGGVKVVGVDATDGKTPVSTYVDAVTYFQQFYAAQIAEPFIHSLSFIKLREISIGYAIPTGKIGIGSWMKGATFSLISRNPLLLYRETESFDPSEISGLQGEDGQYPGTRSLGFNIKFNF